MSELATESIGTGEPRISLLHGFTQTRESWRIVADRLATSHHVTLVDLPGHGDTTARPTSLDEAGQLVAVVAAGSVLVGYSMGARLALHAALQPGSRLRGLVLIGAHPGIVDPAERLIRRESDAQLAGRISEIGVEMFLHEWLDQPMFEGVRDLDHHDRLRNSVDGLAYALEIFGTGIQRVLDEELSNVTVPTLLLAGDRDTKFIDLAARIRSHLSSATFEVIPNAGHACHLEQPNATSRAIEVWLTRLGEGNSDGQ